MSVMQVNSISVQAPSLDAHGSSQAYRSPMKGGRKTTVLKQRYITPGDVQVPTATKISSLSHYAIPINQITAQLAAQAKRIVNGPDGNRKTEVDGFYLLEVGELSFPEDLQQINLTDRKLTSVVDEDLTYFSGLLYVDASENVLPIYPFGALPQLRELRLACNHIQDIGELMGFEKLLYLDLSYNKLKPDTVSELVAMPLLKELDLSGNGLRSLPADLSGFASLEKLVMEYNKFDDNTLFLSLGSIPNLRHLDVSHNYLSVLPAQATEFQGFRFLEVLDLAFNYFGTEDSVRQVLQMPRLIRLILYGNPLLGPMGEDPLFTYIEDLVEEAVRARDAAKTSIPDVDFVTEIPRRRIVKKGQPLGRLALYRDFSIVQVEDGTRELTARQWKAKGVQTLFGETQAQRRGAGNQTGLQTAPSAAALPDFTFITNSIAATNIVAQHAASAPGTATAAAAAGGGQASGAGVLHGPGGLDIDKIADDAMQKVALEMGLIGTGELRIFEELTRMPPTVLEWEAHLQLDEEQRAHSERLRLDEAHSREGDDWDDLGPLQSRPGTEDDGHSQDGSSIASDPDHPLDDEAALPEDRVPGSLFASNIQNVPQLMAQPVALRTAMKALKHALEQPLTDYNEVPTSWSLGGARGHAKQTTSSKLRQLPRIPMQTTEDEGGDEGKWDKRALRFHRRGLAEPPALQKMRQDTRDRTLGQIDMVLTQLNAHTARITTSQKHGQGGDSNTANVGHLRQNMENMRTFSKPKSGVGKLMNMVHNIVEEFNS